MRGPRARFALRSPRELRPSSRKNSILSLEAEPRSRKANHSGQRRSMSSVSISPRRFWIALQISGTGKGSSEGNIPISTRVFILSWESTLSICSGMHTLRAIPIGVAASLTASALRTTGNQAFVAPRCMARTATSAHARAIAIAYPEPWAASVTWAESLGSTLAERRRWRISSFRTRT